MTPAAGRNRVEMKKKSTSFHFFGRRSARA